MLRAGRRILDAGSTECECMRVYVSGLRVLGGSCYRGVCLFSYMVQGLNFTTI